MELVCNSLITQFINELEYQNIIAPPKHSRYVQLITLLCGISQNCLFLLEIVETLDLINLKQPDDSLIVFFCLDRF